MDPKGHVHERPFETEGAERLACKRGEARDSRVRHITLHKVGARDDQIAVAPRPGMDV